MSSRAAIRADLPAKRVRLEKGQEPVPLDVLGAPLIFLAAVHGDPAGYERAWLFFDYVRPDFITVEISPFSVRYRQRAAPLWRRCWQKALRTLPPEASQKLAVARVAAQTALPFEYQAARDWGRAYRVTVKLVDAGKVARCHLPRFRQELLSPENLRLLWETGESGTLEKFVARQYRLARLAREGRLKRLPRAPDEEDRQRERLWARRLARLAAAGKKVVHLGGWEHLVPWEDGQGLTHLLGHLRPRLFLLDEAENLSAREKSGGGEGLDLHFQWSGERD